jgi:hypothetical protein
MGGPNKTPTKTQPKTPTQPRQHARTRAGAPPPTGALSHAGPSAPDAADSTPGEHGRVRNARPAKLRTGAAPGVPTHPAPAPAPAASTSGAAHRLWLSPPPEDGAWATVAGPLKRARRPAAARPPNPKKPMPTAAAAAPPAPAPANTAVGKPRPRPRPAAPALQGAWGKSLDTRRNAHGAGAGGRKRKDPAPAWGDAHTSGSSAAAHASAAAAAAALPALAHSSGTDAPARSWGAATPPLPTPAVDIDIADPGEGPADDDDGGGWMAVAQDSWDIGYSARGFAEAWAAHKLADIIPWWQRTLAGAADPEIARPADADGDAADGPAPRLGDVLDALEAAGHAIWRGQEPPPLGADAGAPADAERPVPWAELRSRPASTGAPVRSKQRMLDHLGADGVFLQCALADDSACRRPPHAQGHGHRRDY